MSLASLVGGVAAADDRFDITGTVLSVDGDKLVILHVGPGPQGSADHGRHAGPKGLQVTPHTPIQLTVMAREYDTYLATGIVRESPYVNGADFGVREEFTARQDSIQAVLGSVPGGRRGAEPAAPLVGSHHRNNKKQTRQGQSLSR